MAIYPSKYAQIPTADLNSWNTDRDVEPVVMTRGVVYKTGGSYYIWDGQSRSDDAGLNRVSAVGVTITGMLSANQQISARSLEGTAHIGQVSAILVDNPVNATYLGRVSVVGSQSATQLTEGTSFIGQVSAILKDNPVNATYLGRVSAITTTDLLVSAHEVKQSDAASLRVSTISEGANLMRVSVIGTSSIGEGTAFIGQVSVTGGQLSATLKEGTSFIGQVSAILKDNPTNATYLGHVSAYMGDAVNLNISAKSNDAGTLRTSSYIPVDTVGQLTVGRLSNLSSSGVIKAAAGTVYGYYAYNSTTTPQYINLTNTSGAINVGTDAIIFKAMLPASAAANVWFGQGLKGFTAGIGAYATSAISDGATTPCATSAVGINLFFN